jgi:hypothetical protein
MTGVTAKGIRQIFAVFHGGARRWCHWPRRHVIDDLGVDEVAKDTHG